MAKPNHTWDCECMKCSWQYTRNARKHWIHDGEYYSTGRHFYLWEVCSCSPIGYGQVNYGYDLYHKSKLIKHGKTVKELKLLAEEMDGREV